MKNTYYKVVYEKVNGHVFSSRAYVNLETTNPTDLKGFFKTESNLSDEEVLKQNLQEEDNLIVKMENYFIPQMARDIS